jgi:hypothetical protein
MKLKNTLKFWFLPQRKQTASPLQDQQVNVFTEKVAVGCDDHTKCMWGNIEN